MNEPPEKERPAERFVAAMKKIIAVPKEELQRREAEYQQARRDGKKTESKKIS